MGNQALVVVDIQLDFCEGGALGVSGGNAVAEKVAQYIRRVGNAYDCTFFTKDWHEAPPSTNGGHFGDPPDFVSSWPVHCVQGTPGAEFHPAIKDVAWDFPLENVFYKGDGRPDYSGFQGFNNQGVSLKDALNGCDVQYVDVVGIAGDYCVRETAIDAIDFGFDTMMLPRLVASVRGNAATADTLFEINRLQHSKHFH